MSDALNIFHWNNILLNITVLVEWYGPAELLSLHGRGHEEGSYAGAQRGLASTLFHDMQLNYSYNLHLGYNLNNISFKQIFYDIGWSKNQNGNI